MLGLRSSTEAGQGLEWKELMTECGVKRGERGEAAASNVQILVECSRGFFSVAKSLAAFEQRREMI